MIQWFKMLNIQIFNLFLEWILGLKNFFYNFDSLATSEYTIDFDPSELIYYPI